MTVRLEIHPGDGGADAERFAAELAHAVGVHFGRSARTEGRVWVLDRL